MKRNKKILLSFLIMALFSFGNLTHIFAKEIKVYAHDGEKYVDIYENRTILDGKVALTVEDDIVTVTLTDYEGKGIKSNDGVDIKIILKGNNKLVNENDEVIDIDGNLTITGDGTLSIENSDGGIKVYNGKLTIDSTTIDIKNNVNGAIYNNNDTATIKNSKISIDTLSDVGIAVQDGGLIIEKSTIDIKNTTYDGISTDEHIVLTDSTITMKNVKSGIYSDWGTLTTNSDINIEAKYFGILVENVIVNDGKIIINVTDYGNTEGFNSAILAKSKININDGYLHLTTNEKSPAIAALKVDDELEFKINEKLTVRPEGYTFKNFTVPLGEEETYDCITLGNGEVTSILDEEEYVFTTTNAGNDIEIGAFVDNPKTVDSINIYITIGALSLIMLIGSIIFIKKKLRNN